MRVFVITTQDEVIVVSAPDEGEAFKAATGRERIEWEHATEIDTTKVSVERFDRFTESA